ncbi:MAG: NYN domain-containing protein, partial [Comamonas sp.]
GVINIRRAYGNWTKAGLKSWESKLLEFALRPMQQYDYSKRKNATDMAMTVDAMELLYTEKPDAFGIVSSDADFTPLVMHLRAKGAAVYGFGMAQTPKPFVNACSRFLYLEALGSLSGKDAETQIEGEGGAGSSQAEPRPVPPRPEAMALGGKPADRASPAVAPAQTTPPVPAHAEPPVAVVAPAKLPQQGLRVPGGELRQDHRLMHLLRDAVQAMQDEEGWASVGALGTQIANKASFDARNYGYATLSKLLSATQAFEMRDEGTSRVAVRDKRPHKPHAGNGHHRTIGN